MSTIHVPSKLLRTRVPSILAKQFRLVPIFLLLLPPRFSVQLLSFRGMRTRDALLQIQMGTYANGATCYYTFPYTNNVLIGPAPWLCAAYELDPPHASRAQAIGLRAVETDLSIVPRAFLLLLLLLFLLLLPPCKRLGVCSDGKLEYTPAPVPFTHRFWPVEQRFQLFIALFLVISFSSLLKQERSNIEMMGRWNVSRVLENLLRWCIKECYESIRLVGLWTFLLFMASLFLIAQ